MMLYHRNDNATDRVAPSPSCAAESGKPVKQALPPTGLVTSPLSATGDKAVPASAPSGTSVSPMPRCSTKEGREYHRARRQNGRKPTEEELASRRVAVDEARFIAGETGTRFVYDPNDPTDSDPGGVHVDRAGWLDLKTREAALTVAKDGSYGRVDFATARRESEEYARALAAKPDIDPDGEPFDGVSAFRMNLLQGLVRHFQSARQTDSTD
jgi:hypothetical protein